MEIDATMMRQIVENVLQQMFGLEVGTAESAPSLVGESCIVSRVRISRESGESLIEVLSPQDTAEIIAEAMFEIPRGELSTDEIHDAMGEIANMIGGSVKGADGGESVLSLPTVSVDPFISKNEMNEMLVSVAGQSLMVLWGVCPPLSCESQSPVSLDME